MSNLDIIGGYSSDTQVFVMNKNHHDDCTWKNISDLTNGDHVAVVTADDRSVKFNNITEIRVGISIGTMLRGKSSNYVDFLVTLDKKLSTHNRNDQYYASINYQPKTFSIDMWMTTETPDTPVPSAMIDLIAMMVCGGNINRSNGVYINTSRYRPHMEYTIGVPHKLNINTIEVEDGMVFSDDQTVDKLKNLGVYDCLDNGGSLYKIPRCIFEESAPGIKRFLITYAAIYGKKGDVCTTYYAKNDIIAGQLQMLAAMVGQICVVKNIRLRKPIISKRPKEATYAVSDILDDEYRMIRKINTKLEDYSGLVYDIKITPYHELLLTRRNGCLILM